jgi:hypothetical protein
MFSPQTRLSYRWESPLVREKVGIVAVYLQAGGSSFTANDAIY